MDTTITSSWDEILEDQNFDPDLADAAERLAVAEIGRLTSTTDADGHDHYWATVADAYNRLAARADNEKA